MKLTIVAGSHRPASESAKVARFIEQVVKRELPGFDSIYVLDVGMRKIPLWDEDAQKPGPRDPHWDAAWGDISNELLASHAFVFVTPEWSGMASPALKNLLVLCDRMELMHKPALLVGVSSGFGGAYPVAELRANSSKDTKVCYIPEQVIVRQVKNILNEPEPQNPFDRSTRDRLRYSLALLLEYAKALVAVRESGVVDVGRFLYGM